MYASISSSPLVPPERNIALISNTLILNMGALSL